MAFHGWWHDDKAAPSAQTAVTWRLWVGPLVWGVHFLAIYGFAALACARTGASNLFGPGSVVGFICATTLLAAGVLGITIWLAVRDGSLSESLPALSRFIHWLTAAIAGLVLLALGWETLAVLFVPLCA
jgi:hypothetical protein